MNMGGPSHPEDTGPFLQRLFQDRDIIELPGGRKYLYLLQKKSLPFQLYCFMN